VRLNAIEYAETYEVDQSSGICSKNLPCTQVADDY